MSLALWQQGGDSPPLCCGIIRTVPSSSGCLGVKSCFVGVVVVSGPAEGRDNSLPGVVVVVEASMAARQLGLSVNLRSLGTKKADGHDAKSGAAGCRWQHFTGTKLCMFLRQHSPLFHLFPPEIKASL